MFKTEKWLLNLRHVRGTRIVMEELNAQRYKINVNTKSAHDRKEAAKKLLFVMVIL